MRKGLLTLLVALTMMMGLSATAQATDPSACGVGTYYDPASDTCLAVPNPAAPTNYGPGGYSGNWSTFCFNGWMFSYCTGNY